MRVFEIRTLTASHLNKDTTKAKELATTAYLGNWAPRAAKRQEIVRSVKSLPIEKLKNTGRQHGTSIENQTNH